MAFWNRSDTLHSAVADWQDRGLIDADLATTLNADITANRAHFSFSNILILLAITLLGFAALTFVAANWEDMSRLARLGLLVLGIWAFWGAAMALNRKGHSWFAATCVLGACIVFGAAIMLVSQMYHMQGPPEGAVLLWFVGTITAAAFARSAPALCLAVLLWVLWLFLDRSFIWDGDNHKLAFLPGLAACAALALWLRSRFAAHVIAMAFIAWLVPNTIMLLEAESFGNFFLILIATFPLASALLWSDSAGRWLNGFERAALLYTLIVMSGVVLIWHIALREEFDGLPPALGIATWIGLAGPLICAALALAGRSHGHANLYDLAAATVAATVTWVLSAFVGGAFVLSEALMLALSIWTIRMGWRLEYRPIAVIGFVGFAAVMLIIYLQTIGTLLGTAAFYFIAGITLLAGVILVPRLTRSLGK